MERDEHIFIVGHKNPDTDSICAAISYACLKNARSGVRRYVPCRVEKVKEV